LQGANEIRYNAITDIFIDGGALDERLLVHFSYMTAMTAFVQWRRTRSNQHSHDFDSRSHSLDDSSICMAKAFMPNI
jgi:hypothetical protein